MNNLRRKFLTVNLVLMLVIGLSACSAVNKIKNVIGSNGDVNYQNNQSVKQLEVPPDLTRPEFDKAFELPTGVISAVSLKNGTAMPQTNAANSTSNNNGVARRGDLSSIKIVAGKTVLQVNDTYPRSLILTEIMLTRIGFSTVSKSAAGDVITAKYNGADVTTNGKRAGWLSKLKGLVGSGSNNKVLSNGKNYRFTIRNEQGSPIVRVAPVSGILSDAGHAKIITLLNNAFNN